VPVIIEETSKSVDGKAEIVSQTITIGCEGPTCKNEPVVVNGLDGTSSPRPPNKTLYAVNYDNVRFTFCGKNCMQAWLATYKECAPPDPGKVVDIGEYKKNNPETE